MLFDSIISRSILHEVCSLVFRLNKNLLFHFIIFLFEKILMQAYNINVIEGEIPDMKDRNLSPVNAAWINKR